MTHGPTANDETRERYAECSACGSRMTHLHAEDCWHCHGGGEHWRSDPLFGGDDCPRELCNVDDADLWW